MHTQRSTRLIPKSLWTKILEVFPNAIMHEFQPPSDECIGNCRECFLDKQLEEQFPFQIKQWKSNIDDNPVLLTVFQNEYIPTIDHGNKFIILHHDQVQGWRNAYSYLQRSKKNVSNDTVRQKLLPLCPSPSSALICKEHQETVNVPDLVLPQPVDSLRLCDLELFTEKHGTSILDSLNALQGILRGNTSSSDPEAHVISAPTATVDNDMKVLVHVEPEMCKFGCVSKASIKEPEEEQGQVQSIDDNKSCSSPILLA